MLLLIGIGLLSGVFIGRQIIKNNAIKNNSTNKLAPIYTNNSNTILRIKPLLYIKNTLDSVPYSLYKRIHSLTGMIFIGGFVVAHFINNSLAYNPKELNNLSKSIHKNPLFPIIEIFGIYLPLVSHIVIGLILLSRGKIDTRIKTETNYRYILQRISAYIILKTLIFHLVTIRFNEYLPDWFRKKFNIPSKRDYTYQKVNVWFSGPLAPIGYLMYISFIYSISYHLSNGIWTSAITWGLAKTYEQQAKLRKLSNIVFIALATWGKIILYLYSKPYSNHEEQDR
ncbi:MAG: hypothetical protein ABDH21_01840 [bacterium]